MEIHAPHQPVLSLKEFMVHLLVVTAGILIALGLEQSVEAFHHHELAVEARENMLSEIRDNKKELDGNLARLSDAQKERERDMSVVTQLLAHKKLENVTMSVNFNSATLNTASWTTASTIGALSYMDYAEVKRFAEVYKLQALFERLQEDEIKSVQTQFGALSGLSEGPEKVPENDLREIKQGLQQSDAAIKVMAQIGKALSDEYAKTLAAK
jgi:hypothetical protein